MHSWRSANPRLPLMGSADTVRTVMRRLHVRHPVSPGAPSTRGAGSRSGFTLIELLVVIAVVAILAGLLLPALQAAKDASRRILCLSNFRQLAMGWHLYADEFDDHAVPQRPPLQPGGVENPANFHFIGNGVKYHPTWIAIMGGYVGAYAFANPQTEPGRQDYDSPVYRCASVPQWVDERNHAYGYNFQFLGNTRLNSRGDPTHFPVKRAQLFRPSEAVLCADSMGTAAGFARAERTPYEKDGTTRTAVGNHAWTLDPPRLTAVSSRGTQNQGRGGVDPRHQGRANALFVDGHARSHTPGELGYRVLADGRYADLQDQGLPDPPHNRKFSGSGEDLDPPRQHL
jgi:prepilin-type N-terminal cleavage/methylation domain-containing protein/prepilin-type processing-associated H-X9-DG protein